MSRFPYLAWPQLTPNSRSYLLAGSFALPSYFLSVCEGSGGSRGKEGPLLPAIFRSGSLWAAQTQSYSEPPILPPAGLRKYMRNQA